MDSIKNPEANVIPNHGMTCTKSNVLNVAKLTDFEVRPIHMPNQASAAMFPSPARPDIVEEKPATIHKSRREA